jgi:hypothetical protein
MLTQPKRFKKEIKSNEIIAQYKAIEQKLGGSNYPIGMWFTTRTW